MQQAHVFISGFVQGVGFRQFIKHSAEQNQIAGWVKNAKDGKVEAVFQGRKDNIDMMILLCRKGPFLSEVKDIQVAWEKSAAVFKEFTVL